MAPDPANRRLAVRELLDRLEVAEGRDAGEAVPGLDEAADGPLAGEFGEFLLGGEGAFRRSDAVVQRVLEGGKRRDVVVSVDYERGGHG
jgi:hypothetical protein